MVVRWVADASGLRCGCGNWPWSEEHLGCLVDGSPESECTCACRRGICSLGCWPSSRVRREEPGARAAVNSCSLNAVRKKLTVNVAQVHVDVGQCLPSDGFRPIVSSH
jgi:hypothetical protein